MTLLALDLETTSRDADTARIVEIALVVEGCADGIVEDEALATRGVQWTSLVHPGVPIPPDATEVHGITDEAVADAPSFDDIAADVQFFLQGAVLLSYNGRSFDVVILDRELREAGQLGIDLSTVPEIDLYRVWAESEKRTLVTALKRFAGIDHEEAHGAKADAAALPLLMEHMADHFGGLTIHDMMRLSRPEHEVDRAGKLKRAEDGEIVFAFGKHKGSLVRSCPEYCDWILYKAEDFAEDTKQAVREILAGRLT